MTRYISFPISFFLVRLRNQPRLIFRLWPLQPMVGLVFFRECHTGTLALRAFASAFRFSFHCSKYPTSVRNSTAFCSFAVPAVAWLLSHTNHKKYCYRTRWWWIFRADKQYHKRGSHLRRHTFFRPLSYQRGVDKWSSWTTSFCFLFYANMQNDAKWFNISLITVVTFGRTLKVMAVAIRSCPNLFSYFVLHVCLAENFHGLF